MYCFPSVMYVTCCLGHAHLSDSTLCWWATTLTDHLPERLGQAKISPYDRWTCYQEYILFPSPSPQSSDPWSLFCTSLMEGSIGEEPVARGSGRRKRSSSCILLTFPNWGLLAMVKAWQCDQWWWHVALVSREDLSKRREDPPATSSTTLALIFNPFAVILHTCLFTLKQPSPILDLAFQLHPLTLSSLIILIPNLCSHS